ncbi:MAG: 3'-5' exonuclease [Candidatus Hydrogenedentota bacterium]
MTPKDICKVVYDSLFGPYLKIGSRKECAICDAKIICKEVITAKSKINKEHQTFFVCKTCFNNLNKSKKHLISEKYFIETLKKLRRFKSIVFIDIETTGFLEEGGEIIEIGCLKYNIKKKLSVDINGIFFQRIKPKTNFFSQIAQKVNNIKSEDLVNCPSIEKVLPKFLEFIDHSLVVAHRVNFDMGFLNHYFDKLQIKRPSNPVLDTFQIGKKLYGKSVRLDGLLKENKIRVPFSRHKSWIDCLSTSEVFFKMVRWYSISELNPLPFSTINYSSNLLS